MAVVVVVGMASVMCSVSESWGGGIPNLDRDHSVPRFRHYLYNYSSLLPPQRFQPFLDNSFSLPDLTPITPRSSICRRFFYLLLHPLLPPNSPGHGASVHCGGAPNRLPPPFAYTSLPCWATTSSYLRDPVSAFTCPVDPPSPSLNCSQVPDSPRGSPVWGSHPSSSWLCCPHICYFPCRPRPVAQSLAYHKGFLP